MALMLAPKARTFLLVVFAAAIAFVVVRAVVHVSVQMETSAVMSDSMARIMAVGVPKGQPGARQAAQATQMATVVMKASVFLGMGVTLVIALAEVIFYAVGARYLCRPNVRRLFEERSVCGCDRRTPSA
jgi:hypothetical protein